MARIKTTHAVDFRPTSLNDIETVEVTADLLIIGGGNAGCFVATEAAKAQPRCQDRYCGKGRHHALWRVFCRYGRHQHLHPCRQNARRPRALEPLAGRRRPPARRPLLSNARELNECVDDLERWGLPILRDEQGNIRYRGKWDISIHGEQLKPIMAEKALETGADVYNRVAATGLLVHNGRCTGATGFGVRDGKFYVFRARATVVSTGGAGTLYKSTPPTLPS